MEERAAVSCVRSDRACLPAAGVAATFLTVDSGPGVGGGSTFICALIQSQSMTGSRDLAAGHCGQC